MKYLLLFDIDGTILKFKSYNSREIFSNMMKEIFGREIPFSMMPNFSGMTDLQILQVIAKKVHLSKADLDKKLNEVWDILITDFKQYCTPEYITLLPGMDKLLIGLDKNKDFQLGLLTGNFKENAYLKLAAFDLEEYFPFGAFGSDNANRNKLPEIALYRANQFSGNNTFSAKNTLILGDTYADIECAKSNNLPVLTVCTGNMTAEELKNKGSDVVIENFSDYEDVVEKIYRIF